VLEHPDTTTSDNAAQGIPTWVESFAVAAAILAVLVVVLLLTGGHGPGRHLRGGLSAPTVGQRTSMHLVPG